MARQTDEDGVKVIARNRKARHDYHIEDTLEAGLVLQGAEVKSLRAGRFQLTGGYVVFDRGEAWLRDVYIPPYEQASMDQPDPNRPRKLLLTRRELNRLATRTSQPGYTLVPLQLHFRRGKAKLLMGVARGKRAYDKREALRNREARRESERELAARRRMQ